MTITSQLILILSAFGAMNGFFVAIFLWGQQHKKIANRFLAVMLIMISIRTLKSVLFYFNPDLAKELLQIGLSACFLIGPLLYFYCLSHLNQLEKALIPWKIHLASLVAFIILLGLLYPYHHFEVLWGNSFYKGINYLWLIYILLALKVIFPKIKAISKKIKLSQEDIWLINIFIGNVLIWFAYFSASYTSYIVGAMSFTFILSIICLLVLFSSNKKISKVKYGDKKIKQDEADAMLNRLNTLMITEELYKNSLITMPQIAKRLSMPTPLFSQLLNDNLNKSFSLFINEFRIEASKMMLSAANQQKMEVIAEQCGFNSQSNFYSVFKKLTSQTPATFRAKYSPKL